MRTHARLLLATAAASLFLMSADPAEAHRNRWRGGNQYYFGQLQAACSWGDRWACIQVGKILGRSQFRQPFYGSRFHDPFPRHGWNRHRWSPPRSGFYFRFESR